MTEFALEPGVLQVASAFPDPPSEVTINGAVHKGSTVVHNEPSACQQEADELKC
jgi:hypothetical protein